MNDAELIEVYKKIGVKLMVTGSKLRGLCPFHKEKLPSFVVYPKDGSFHCFGCGKHGNFRDVQRLAGADTGVFPLFRIDIDGVQDPSTILLEKVFRLMENQLLTQLRNKPFSQKACIYDKFDRIKMILNTNYNTDDLLEIMMRLKTSLKLDGIESV